MEPIVLSYDYGVKIQVCIGFFLKPDLRYHCVLCTDNCTNQIRSDYCENYTPARRSYLLWAISEL